MMDKIKRGIIGILQGNANISNEQMADMLGISEEEVNKNRKELEDDGIIMKYVAVVNTEIMDIELTEAMIELKVTPQRDLGYNDIAMRVSKFPWVKAVYLVSGSYDLLVKVEAKTMQEICAFVWEKLAVLDGISSTATLFIMKKYKENAMILHEGDKDERLVITP